MIELRSPKPRPLVVLALALAFAAGCRPAGDREAALAGRADPSEKIRGEEKAVLTDAPAVPPAIARDHPTKVVVELEILEAVGRLADGVDYTFWTFGGKVPGKFIRIREGDHVEFHLHNHPGNKNPHNIDLHAVNGPGGGASSSLTAPGHSSVFSFRALNPGLYVYHCATAPVGMHVANGMYGLIFVEPKEGLPKVDREYYVMQGDFYTIGANGEPGLQPFSMAKAMAEDADYVVFNGSVGALLGDAALPANVGQTVRLFVGNGGPNLTSSFHVIGEIFDKVWIEGGSNVNENVQTTMIPAGGAAIVEFRVNAPGRYVIVDHALTRAFNKGALAQLKVFGDEDKATYSGKLVDQIYLPEGAQIRSTEPAAVGPPAARSREERMARGRDVYRAHCAACHQPDGRGVEAAFPPLAKSDYLNEDKLRAVKAVANDLTGKIVVNGKPFDSVMPKLDLSDEAIANVLTYVYGSWDNEGLEITPEEVKGARGATAMHAE